MMASTVKKRRDHPTSNDVGRGRHKKVARPSSLHHQGLVAVTAVPKSKHYTYFEIVENKAKKKKLEFQITTDTTPPPGFEFVPIGFPELTTACKEISRERDAMIFIVSESKHADLESVAHQVHRVGHHIRQIIVEEARASLSHLPERAIRTSDGAPKPIPADQNVYNTQADAAIRDLFPRIPNTDREMIIRHAFQLDWSGKGDPPVGLSGDITLARRVQLATLAHIRHTHTRYDDLLRETNWNTARKVVEQACLDKIVKWRGDEETGRDQLDEILQEVVVISDSEEDDESVSDSSLSDEVPVQMNIRVSQDIPRPSATSSVLVSASYRSPGISQQLRLARAEERKNQRGFKRYRAFNEAIRRNEVASSAPQGSLPQERPPAAPYPHESGHVYGGQVRVIVQEDSRLPHSPTFASSNHPNIATSSHRAGETLLTDRQQRFTSGDQLPNSSTSSLPLQDWLVPSVERPSAMETMKPAFVRPVPPRNLVREEPAYFANRQNREPNECHTGSPRHVIRDTPRNNGIYHSNPGRPNADIYYQAHPYEEHQHFPVNDNHVPAESMSRLGLGSHAPTDVPPQRILVGTGRLGDRNNPILMEDRGGFFERVPLHVEQALYPESDQRGPGRAYPGPVAHRIVSSAEGSRILQQSYGRDVELFHKHQIMPSDQPRNGSDTNALWPSRPPPASRIIHRDHPQNHPDRMSIDPQPPAAREEPVTPVFWQIRRDRHGSAFEPHLPEASSEQRAQSNRAEEIRRPAPSPIVID